MKKFRAGACAASAVAAALVSVVSLTTATAHAASTATKGLRRDGVYACDTDDTTLYLRFAGNGSHTKLYFVGTPDDADTVRAYLGNKSEHGTNGSELQKNPQTNDSRPYANPYDLELALDGSTVTSPELWFTPTGSGTDSGLKLDVQAENPGHTPDILLTSVDCAFSNDPNGFRFPPPIPVKTNGTYACSPKTQHGSLVVRFWPNGTMATVMTKGSVAKARQQLKHHQLTTADPWLTFDTNLGTDGTWDVDAQSGPKSITINYGAKHDKGYEVNCSFQRNS